VPPSVSVSIKVIPQDIGPNEKAKEVAHILIVPIEGSSDGEHGDYKYRVQEPGGGMQEGEIEGFHEDRGVLTLLGLVISASGHYGQVVRVPASDIAKLLGHEKLEEIHDKLEEQGD
jgi:hypothetical protein